MALSISEEINGIDMNIFELFHRSLQNCK